MIPRTLCLAGVAVLLGTAAHDRPLHPSTTSATNAEISANDNRTRAGVLRDGVLRVSLVAGAGTWFPEDKDGPGHDVFAFGEEGRALQAPGPLLRVPVGTELHITLRNALDTTLVVYGLHDRPGTGAPIQLAPRGTSEVRFKVSAPGAYYYWGSTSNARLLRDRWGKETQLGGALIVDEPGARTDEHVFVIGIEDGPAVNPAERDLLAAVVNGRSWPHSHQSSVQQGDTVRMRWINLTSRSHPLHLHGFYFRVDRFGDIAQDTIYGSDQQRSAVTELANPGQTMSIAWVPDRPGNWLLHCHMALHMSHTLRRGAKRANAAHKGNHSLESMSGLVTGWRVLPRGALAKANTPAGAEHRVRLLVQAKAGVYGQDPGLGFVIQNGSAPRADSVAIPGPALVLERDQPARITVVNRLREPTSIHWHGIELDSYYDGVSGWSGLGGSILPQIEPGDSLIVRFTPPRAGTFIYHSHFSEEKQLGSGMYGPLIVLEPGRRYDPETDRTWVIGSDGPRRGVRVLLNGSRAPVLDLAAGQRYRIRLINIHTNVPLVFSVRADSVPVRWRTLAKDGADLPVAQQRVQPAVQRIGVGEAYDFEFTPSVRGELRISALDPAGREQLSGRVRVR
jgi:FtsP/CotA-like multicopper oxidase with cupredoxin domain